MDGGPGLDTMYGGAGADTYYVDSTGDVVDETVDQPGGVDDGAIDTVVSNVSFTLGVFVENIKMYGASDIDGTGNALANLIYGNSGANSLYGMDGNDTLRGFDGNDTLHGGIGNDYLEGNNGNDQLYGDAGNDTLISSAGHDSLYGGSGDDIYYINDVGTAASEESTGAGADDGGHDQVSPIIDYTLGNFIEDLIQQGSANITGTGNAMDNRVYGNSGNNSLFGMGGNDALRGFDGNDTMHGGTGGDFLDGGNGTDQVYGDAGNDTLMSGPGNDSLYGGSGDDVYYVNDSGTVVSEESTGAGIDDRGHDQVRATIDYTLGNFIEDLLQQGSANIAGTGNSLDNRVYGNSGNNVLSGLDGNDAVRGFDGDDSLLGGNGNDYFEGGNGDDTIVGGAGNDYMYGNAGADAFVFGAAGAANGIDRIGDFVGGADRLLFTAADYGFAAGHALTSAEFVIGTAASGTNGQFIWNPTTHTLYWDHDGIGADVPVAIAIFTNGATVHPDDFHFL